MEESCARLASRFCGELRTFCSRLERSARDIRIRIERAPSRGESDSAKFVENLSLRVVDATGKIEALKELVTETASFQELLDQCTEVYERNQRDIEALVGQLEQYGYKAKEAESFARNDDLSSIDEDLDLPENQGVQGTSTPSGSLYATGSTPSTTEADSLYADSLSLKDFGLSASSMAALSVEDAFSPELNVPQCAGTFGDGVSNINPPREDSEDVSPAVVAANADNTRTDTFCTTSGLAQGSRAAEHLKLVTTEEFNNAPSWLKWQASLELLNEFASKLDHLLSSKPADSGDVLTPSDLGSLPYPAQVQKACLLLLVKLQRLETGFRDGATTYKPAR